MVFDLFENFDSKSHESTGLPAVYNQPHATKSLTVLCVSWTLLVLWSHDTVHDFWILGSGFSRMGTHPCALFIKKQHEKGYQFSQDSACIPLFASANIPSGNTILCNYSGD